MTLTAIKIKIKIQLSKLTIDDFYADPGLGIIKELFARLTGQKTNERIEKYLTHKYYDTLNGSKIATLEQRVSDLNHQISTLQSQIQSFGVDSDNLNREAIELERIKAEISSNTVEFIATIKEIDVEIQLLNQIPNKSHYLGRIEELKKTKQNKINKLENFPILLEKINSELALIKEKRKIIQDRITSNENEIKRIETKINQLEQEIANSRKQEITFHKNEFSSLNFLFTILLKKAIRKELEFITGDNGHDLKLQPGSEENHGKDEALYIEDCGFKSFYEFVTKYINAANTIPGNWRKLLFQTLSTALPNLSGTITQQSEDEEFSFRRDSQPLTNSDISSLLAIKSSLRKNHSLKTADQRITLGLSGGVSATLTFRNKGEIIGKFQKQQFEIFAKCMFAERFVNQTLYHQQGHTSSSISIETPGAYYMLTSHYVIEIEFNPAPVLFDNSNVIKYAPNISVIAQRDAEMAGLAAEEKSSHRDDDEYYSFS